MASKRHVTVGGVQIGGGAPVAVQSMTKTETANLAATMEQIRTVADAGADLVRVAVPREKDVEALKTIVKESPIPVIADIHFNHTLALKSIDAGAHCIRLNPGNIGGTIRISLSTFHAEEEVKVAWEILKALKLREKGPVLIACPTCGRLQFDMDTVVADIERRLAAYADPIEVAVLGCAVNGIGEASHADFGITGAKNEGLIFSRGKALKKVPQERLVDELFAEIDKYVSSRRIDVDAGAQAEGAEWLARIEEENAGDMTPERLAAPEKAKQEKQADLVDAALTAGRAGEDGEAPADGGRLD